MTGRRRLARRPRGAPHPGRPGCQAPAGARAGLTGLRRGRDPLVLRTRRQYLVVGTLRGTVRFIAVGAPTLSDKRLKRLLEHIPG